MRNNFLLLLIALSVLACQPGTKGGESTDEEMAAPAANALTEEEKAAGWELLFDGQSMDKWRVYLKDTIVGWKVENGEMVALGEPGLSADIITKDTFSNLELSLEWKVSPGGNSGIFFNVVENPGFKAVYESGPEYQIVDDLGFPEPLKPSQKSAANYDLHPPGKPVAKAAGEWNQARIVVNQGHVEHWLNGEKVVEYDLWSPDWEALIPQSKWKDFPGYGRARSGHLALQDHGNMIWFKNIKVRRL